MKTHNILAFSLSSFCYIRHYTIFISLENASSGFLFALQHWNT